ncbi:tetraacyldisaccharide 4'-kinase [Larkinella terrae]|uniref:tetraacyldisaccharide 4'-kinase n=1 Tax=Larkinella terrae TaxID=2025311 RepID=UPI0012AE8365|nr:tetraacyldisaccharide 4'-kinase [Larkinella terrae]
MLTPLNWLYGGITDVRNLLYDSSITKSLRPPIYTISVGNLTVGGTGKTPHVDYLVDLLKKTAPTATLSRGYGRRTHGFRIATDVDTADTIGDEPLLLYRKHGKTAGPDQVRVTVSVGEKRAEAITKLLEYSSDLQVIILDDAFQHRPVQPHLNILLTDFNRPFYQDQPFPGGRLRERRHGARRADLIVVTKCPDNLSSAEQTGIRQRIQVYSRADVPVFFTGFRYGKPVCFLPELGVQARNGEEVKSVVLVSGIARPEPLEEYVKARFSMLRHLQFADHYRYTPDDLEKIQRAVPPGAAVLTTEKDFVKLAPLVAEMGADATGFYYLPIEVKFLKDENRFREMSTQFQR